MLGTRVPQRPARMLTAPSGSDSWPDEGAFGGLHTGVSYGRPGEPMNKVFVQLSTDLEGFLPYTLVISAESGLEFFSLSAYPDFVVDPSRVIHASMVEYDSLMADSFFAALSRAVRAKANGCPQPGDGPEANPANNGAACGGQEMEERWRPPYKPMVQMGLRQSLAEGGGQDGGQVLAFVAVQTEYLAREMLRGAQLSRRLRATGGAPRGCVSASSGAVSRGCPSPRTVAGGSSLCSTARGAGAGRGARNACGETSG